MPTVAQHDVEVTGGVDTHMDTHTAAAADTAGRMLGSARFPASAAGYRRLLTWLRSLGTLVLVGVEGTGAYGAGLARYLRAEGVALVEIDRPDRKARRWQGKSDPVDARPPHAPRWPPDAPGHPRTVTEKWRRCATFEWPAAAPSPNAPTSRSR